MSITGMYMLNSSRYDEEKMQQAIDILYIDRKNQFQEILQALVNEKVRKTMSSQREFVLNFCLDVEDSFRKWSGQEPLQASSPQKSLTLLRQIGHDKKNNEPVGAPAKHSIQPISRIQRDLQTPKINPHFLTLQQRQIKTNYKEHISVTDSYLVSYGMIDSNHSTGASRNYHQGLT